MVRLVYRFGKFVILFNQELVVQTSQFLFLFKDLVSVFLKIQ